MKTKKIAMYGLLLALAFIFSYIEGLVPTPPGIKLGVANMVVLVALYQLGTRDAFIISIVRIVLVGFTFGNLYSMLYGLAGGLLSFAVMALLKNSKHFGMLGVSVAGGVTHNLGQIVVAMLVVERHEIIYYYPLLLLSGIVAGIMVGLLATLVLKRMKKLH